MGGCCTKKTDEACTIQASSHPLTRVGTKHVEQVVVGIDDNGRRFINEYSFIRQLGTGRFGTLNLCIHYKSQQPYAVRQVARQVSSAAALGM